MSERNRALSSFAISQRRRSVMSRTHRRMSSSKGEPSTSTSRHPSGVRNRSSSSVPISLPITLAIDNAATCASSGWMNSKPLRPTASPSGRPKSRSAARFAHRSSASELTTNSGSGIAEISAAGSGGLTDAAAGFNVRTELVVTHAVSASALPGWTGTKTGIFAKVSGSGYCRYCGRFDGLDRWRPGGRRSPSTGTARGGGGGTPTSREASGARRSPTGTGIRPALPWCWACPRRPTRR